MKCEKKETSEGILRGLFTSPFYLFACLILTLSACEEPFQPLKDNDRSSFSIYGYLDASADTQWVRVTPLREQLEQPPVKPPMQVILEKVESGGSVVMGDSLLLYPDGFHILNAWTDMNVKPVQTYRLRAEQPDGAASGVTVTIPDNFSPQLINRSASGCSAKLVIDNNVEHLADVQYRWHVRVKQPGWEYTTYWTVPYRNRVQQEESGEYILNINFLYAREQAQTPMDTLPANTTVEILDRHLFVVSAGPEWLGYEELLSVSDLEYSLPNHISNVENGVGYVIGIVSKTIPDDQCPG